MKTKSRYTPETAAIDKAIGERILLARREAGLSQEKLGDELDVTFQQVQKYEKGINAARGSRLVQIARACSVPVLFLFPDDVCAEHIVDFPRRIETKAHLAAATTDGQRLLAAIEHLHNAGERLAVRRLADIAETLAILSAGRPPAAQALENAILEAAEAAE